MLHHLMIEFVRVAQYVGKCGELWGGNLTVIAFLRFVGIILHVGSCYLLVFLYDT